jgi:hypothetical protein
VTSAPAETIRIESATRWDALDLVRRLPDLHTHLVQLGDRRWHVCVRPEGPAEELVPFVLGRAAVWAAERHLDAVLRVGDRSYELHA